MQDVPINIVLVGVGGQGVLTASEALARAALHGGFDVKKSEVHGMAQRGGSVLSQVRFGVRVHSPVVPAGSAGFLVAFEMLEGLRSAGALRAGGVLLLNRLEIPPMSAAASSLPGYPRDMPRDMEGAFACLDAEVLTVAGQELAEGVGDVRAAGSVLLGVLSEFLPIKAASWKKAFTETFRPEAVRPNMEAFRLGRSWVSTATR
jgi:indolepyruvate ferredoxin oxidoreductase beta subunit